MNVVGRDKKAFLESEIEKKRKEKERLKQLLNETKNKMRAVGKSN
jgi:hypothetical protein